MCGMSLLRRFLWERWYAHFIKLKITQWCSMILEMKSKSVTLMWKTLLGLASSQSSDLSRTPFSITRQASAILAIVLFLLHVVILLLSGMFFPLCIFTWPVTSSYFCLSLYDHLLWEVFSDHLSSLPFLFPVWHLFIRHLFPHASRH